MAERIVWAKQAIQDRKEILAYWTHRNGTASYSGKLNLLFRKAVLMIKDHPEMGKATDIPGVRFKWVRDYQVSYRQTQENIQIIRIWDYRRDSDTFQI